MPLTLKAIKKSIWLSKNKHVMALYKQQILQKHIPRISFSLLLLLSPRIKNNCPIIPQFITTYTNFHIPPFQ